MNDFSDTPRPEKLERTVEKVLKDNDLQSVLFFSKIQKHWEIIVGKPLAAKTAPVKLHEKTLIVEVEDAAYSHHLKYYESNIIDLIASPEICGEGIVKKVVYQVGKSAKKQMEESISKTETESLSIDAAIQQSAEQQGESIQDRKLKNVFVRLMSRRVSLSKDHGK